MARALAERAVPVGVLHYVQQDGLSLKPDTLSCFDLELPADFAPRPVDGEVEAFVCMPVASVIESLAGEDPWKPTSALVVVDFLLRHGALDAHVAAAQRWDLWRTLRGE
jgi:hypothetical protein